MNVTFSFLFGVIGGLVWVKLTLLYLKKGPTYVPMIIIKVVAPIALLASWFIGVALCYFGLKALRILGHDNLLISMFGMCLVMVFPVTRLIRGRRP